MPAGRPSKYEDIDLKQVEFLAKEGFTDQKMADFFGVDRANWYRWKNKYPKFRDALKKWKDKSDENVERSLFERANGYDVREDKIFMHEGHPIVVPTIKHYPPDPTSMIFWLKNRQPEKWREKPENNQEDQKDPIKLDITIRENRS